MLFRSRAPTLEVGLRIGGVGAAMLGQLGLESFHLRAGSDPARTQHLGDTGNGVFIDARTSERNTRVHVTELREMRVTPTMMMPMPSRRLALNCSPKRYHAATAFTM